VVRIRESSTKTRERRVTKEERRGSHTPFIVIPGDLEGRRLSEKGRDQSIRSGPRRGGGAKAFGPKVGPNGIFISSGSLARGSVKEPTSGRSLHLITKKSDEEEEKSSRTAGRSTL